MSISPPSFCLQEEDLLGKIGQPIKMFSRLQPVQELGII